MSVIYTPAGIEQAIQDEWDLHQRTGAHIGFHGDWHLLRIAFTCLSGAAAFIETGTGSGTTLATVARTFPHLPCFSCEPDAAERAQAEELLALHANAQITASRSLPFLDGLAEDAALAEQPLVFYLDAHSDPRDISLPDEVRLITARFPRASIFINDFFVPFQPQFGYDIWGDHAFHFDFIKGSLNPGRSYQIVLPTYREKTSDFHPLRGWALIRYGEGAPLDELLRGGPYVQMAVPGAEAARRLGHAELVCHSRAEEALVAGSLAATEAICSILIERDPNDARALNLLGRLCARIGLHRVAAQYLRRAARAGGADQRRLLLDLASFPAEHAPRPPPAEPRYLLHRAWGAGLGTDLQVLLGALFLAELSGRQPVVHWGENCLYRDDRGSDAFRHYFEPVSALRIEDLARPGWTFYPSSICGDTVCSEATRYHPPEFAWQWPVYLINRPEQVVVSDHFTPVYAATAFLEEEHPFYGCSLLEINRRLARRYLRPQPVLRAAIDEFYDQHLRGAPFLAVHARGSDKITEQADLHQLNERYPEFIDRHSPTPDCKILLITDSEALLERFRARYGARICVTPSQRTHGEQGVHLSPNMDRVRLGLEVLRDIYLAARAECFIGNGNSSVSAIVSLLQDRQAFVDLGRSWQTHRSFLWPYEDTRARDARYVRR